MNANAIHPGEEYAYTPWPSRGKAFYQGCYRVRVLHVYKGLERQYYRKNLTLVECVRLLPDGEVDESKHLITAPARHFVSTWKEYLTEKERHDKERAEMDARIAKARAERERIHEERLAAQKKKREAVLEYVSNITGIDRQYIHLDHSYVLINKSIIERRIAEIEGAESTTDSKPSFTSETSR